MLRAHGYTRLSEPMKVDRQQTNPDEDEMIDIFKKNTVAMAE